MLLANTRLVTHWWAVHHLISSHFFGGNARSQPSLHVAAESTSRVTQHQHRSTAKTGTKQQHSSGLALCSHVTLDVIAHQWLQPGHLLMLPATERLWMAPQKRPISRPQDARGLELTFALQQTSTWQSFRRHGNTTNGQVCHIQRSSLLIQVPRRQQCERQRPVCLLAVWRVSQQSKP